MSLEAGCKDSGLSVEVWDGAVIPDYVIGFLGLLSQLKLGSDYGSCCFGRKSAFMCQPGKLRLAMARDDDDPVELRLRPSFIKERDVNHQPFAVGAGGIGEGCPAGTDYRMKDFFEDSAVIRLAKNEHAQLAPVRPAVGCTSLTPKLRSDGSTHIFIGRKKLVDTGVRVKMLHGQMPAKQATESAFSCGDAAGETDDWQRKITATSARACGPAGSAHHQYA